VPEEEAQRVLSGLKGLFVKGRRIGVDIAEATQGSADGQPAKAGKTRKNRAQRRFEQAQANGKKGAQGKKHKRDANNDFAPAKKKNKKDDWQQFFKTK